jgi:imidazoleglycerol phosphate synthase glutamine amidotransferase subunit HisH
MKKILYLYFFKGSAIHLSRHKYIIDKIYVFSKNLDFNRIKKSYDMIILGGGKPGLPVASDVVKYVPQLYKFLDNCSDIPILGICYGMEVLYTFYYGRRAKLLKTRNVNTFDVCLDQRYREAKVIGDQFCNVKFNHKYYCDGINSGIISYILYNDTVRDKKNYMGTDTIVKIPSFVKFTKNHYGIQFHLKNTEKNDCIIRSIID